LVFEFLEFSNCVKFRVTNELVGVITPGCLKALISFQAERPMTRLLAKA
jgi:hypothetical protein